MLTLKSHCCRFTGLFCRGFFYVLMTYAVDHPRPLATGQDTATSRRSVSSNSSVAVVQTSLLQTCGHLTYRTSTRLTIPSGQSCSSMCIRLESMISTSCNSVYPVTQCGVYWNSALWMMPLISGSVVWEPVSTQKADILNIAYVYKLLMRILCRYFNAFVQTFQCSCEKGLFSDFTR